MNDLEDQKFKVGISMIIIDVFDKFMHVVAAVKGKKEEDLASGMIVFA